MSEQTLVLALAAGMLATVNPCGFAMLPAYLAWFLGLDAPRRAIKNPQTAGDGRS